MTRIDEGKDEKMRLIQSTTSVSDLSATCVLMLVRQEADMASVILRWCQGIKAGEKHCTNEATGCNCPVLKRLDDTIWSIETVLKCCR